jgi:uncharacterized protein
MKRTYCVAVIGILLSLIIQGIQAQTLPAKEIPVCLDNTEQFILSSGFVRDETYLIQVGLPFNYHSSKESYPVLYVLDGDRAFGIAKGIADWLRIGNEIKDIIVVGISYGQGISDWWVKRARDYTYTNDTIIAKGRFENTGGADNFINFMQNELIPQINIRYRTLPDSCFISGLSFGGLLCTYILFNNPEMFRGYIISAPTLVWDNRGLLRMEIEYSTKNKELNRILYFADGTLKDPVWTDNPNEEFIANIKSHNYSGLVFISQIYKEETHISVFPTAITNGLKTMFSH